MQPMFQGYFHCSGTENELAQCSANVQAVTCGHRLDAYVVCREV